MSARPASIACFDYLQQSDGITVSQLWQVFKKTGRSTKYASSFDPEIERQLGLKVFSSIDNDSLSPDVVI